MIVVNIRTNRVSAEIMFAESAMIYMLLSTNPLYDDILAKLDTARVSGQQIQIQLDRPHGNTIVGIN